MKIEFIARKNIKFALFIICLLINSPMWSQVREVKNAPSPEVANLGTFGSVPVGHYTGTPDISVPLYTMKVGKLSIPIQARYHLANVKPHTPPSSLGIGWTLCAGGYIARNVKGVTDEKTTSVFRPEEHRGYYYNHHKVNDINESQNKPESLKHYTLLHGNDWYELSADEFTFNFCGYSGTFFMDGDGQWRVISDDNIKVEFDPKTGFRTIEDLLFRFRVHDYKKDQNKKLFNKFTLITPDGTRYTFGGYYATEYSVPFYYQYNGELVATCWRLSRIETVDNRVIDFDYETDSYMCDIHYAPQMFLNKTKYQGQSTNAKCDLGVAGFTGFLMMPSRLVGIRSDEETITFDYNHDKYYGDFFLGIDDNLKCLYWTGSNLHSMYQNLNNMDWDNYLRRFYHLLNIEIAPFDTERDIREKIAAKITQHYLSNMTVRKSKRKRLKIDFSYVPRTSLKNNENRKLLSRIAFYSESLTAENVNDSSEPEGVMSLKTYVIVPDNPPDKESWDSCYEETERGYGASTFEYDYRFDYNIEDSWPQRDPLIYTDAWGYYVRFGPCSKGNGEWKLIPEKKDLNFEFRDAWLPDTKIYTLKSMTYPTGGKTEFEYELNNYSKVYDLRSNTLKNSSGTSGGLRVKALRHYDELGTLMYAKSYTYKSAINGPSSGISKGIPCYHETIYLTDDKQEYIEIFSHDDMNPYPLNFNAPDVGYSTVFEDLIDKNHNLLTRTKYQYTNYDADTNGKSHMDTLANCTANVYGDYAIASFTSMSFERGKLTLKEVMDANNNVLERTTYDYIRSDGDPYPTVSQEMYWDNYGNQYDLSYLFKTYANRYLISTEKKQEFVDNGVLSCETQYQYTSFGLPRQIKVIPKSGKPHYTIYNYSLDKEFVEEDPDTDVINGGLDSVLTRLMEKNIIVPIMIVEREDFGFLSRVNISRNFFSLTSDGVPYLLKTYNQRAEDLEAYLSASWGFPDYYVTKTDKYGNPIELEEGGIKKILIWSYYGQRVIASIQGATYDEVKEALGRLPGDLSTEYSFLTSLDFLRKKLPDAAVYTYSYDVGLNQIRKTEPNGLSHIYVYDSFDRLIAEYREINGNKELLNSYKYNYLKK